MGQVIKIKGLRTGDIGFGTVDNPSEGGGGQEPSVDEAIVYINYVGGLSTPEQTAIKTLVSGLKSKGLWSKMTAIYPLLGTGATGRGANLIDTTKNLTFTGYSSTSEDVKGWKGVAGMWGQTGLTGSWNANYGGVYMAQKLGGSQVAFSVSNISSAIMSIISYGNGLMTTQTGNAGTNINFPTNDGVGMFSMSTQSTSVDVYYNNTKLTAAKPTSSGTTELQMMGYNSGNMIGVGSIISIALFGEYLTESEVLNLNALIEAFLTSIGRK